MKEYKKHGYVANVLSFNTILNKMEDPGLTPLLQLMILESAAPLVACETEAAYADSLSVVRLHNERYGPLHVRRGFDGRTRKSLRSEPTLRADDSLRLHPR